MDNGIMKKKGIFFVICMCVIVLFGNGLLRVLAYAQPPEQSTVYLNLVFFLLMLL